MALSEFILSRRAEHHDFCKQDSLLVLFRIDRFQLEEQKNCQFESRLYDLKIGFVIC